MKQILLIFIAINLFSCNYFTFKKDDRKPVARVNDSYLYESDLQNIFTSNNSKQDSIKLVKNYINSWIKHELLLNKAKLNLVEETKKFEELVKKYREDLFINSYKEKVVEQYLDTVVTENDIENFYKNNHSNFRLSEDLIKLKYIKIGKNVLNKKELTKLFKSDKQEDLDSLKTKELQLKSMNLNDSIWVKYSDLVSKVPIFKDIDKKQLLKKDYFIQKEDSLSLYLLKISNVLVVGNFAPKSYIKPTIKQVILQQRKLKLLKNIEETLVNDARKKQQFEIY
ncbi:MAG: peptidyl-prolyl cis-trans isomerase [Lutibacter sp.]|uniref:peptidyl-prolyl cis-trans isomerase n=1 Tax=Lutibacter sp. TaxID=1925666 RepID=UPI00299D3970|nr:peptidyl-prolyl cis-trans isomerase [Lutibacter sp.]MDX1827916.1 peptidyl-prolyl cis-trans isomerase [Lutibacter sp.]